MGSYTTTNTRHFGLTTPSPKTNFSQVDAEGKQHFLLDCIADHNTNGMELLIDEAYINLKNGGCCKLQTTKGWEILIQWKDGSTTWEPLKDIK